MAFHALFAKMEVACAAMVRRTVLDAQRIGIAGQYLDIAGGAASWIEAVAPLTRSIGVGLDQPISEAEIVVMDEFFESRQAPSVVEISSRAHPDNWNLLRRAGFTLVKTESVLFRQLEDAEDFPLAPVTQALADERERWAELLVTAFTDRDSLPPGADIRLGRVFSGFDSFLAWDEGKAAATGALILQDGLAFFAADATLPRHRRRGLQRALIQKRLEVARKAGATFAFVDVLNGTGSEQNYLNCGFYPAYQRLTFLHGDDMLN
jgi:GNAT superfamily N-acetyltransferase